MIEVDPLQVWKEKKWGKFSASEEWKLLTGGTLDKKTGTKSLFGEGAMTYIKTVARQAYTMYNEEDQPETYAMKLGKAKEAGSFVTLCDTLGGNSKHVLQYYGGLQPLFYPYTEDSGTSPDSVAWKDMQAGIASFGAELKNPSGNVHMEYLLTIKDQKDLKEKALDYYTQVQKAMLTFKCDTWLWCSHNEYFRGKDRLLVIVVDQDKNFQNDLDARIAAATKKKYEFIEQLKNRQ